MQTISQRWTCARSKSVVSENHLEGCKNKSGYWYPLRPIESKMARDNMSMSTSQKRFIFTVGHYTAEIFSYDRTELKFISYLSQNFDLTEENSFDRTFSKSPRVCTSICSFNQPFQRRLQWFWRRRWDRIFLPAEKYGHYAFGKKVATGRYILYKSPCQLDMNSLKISFHYSFRPKVSMLCVYLSCLSWPLLAVVNQQKN